MEVFQTLNINKRKKSMTNDFGSSVVRMYDHLCDTTVLGDLVKTYKKEIQKKEVQKRGYPIEFHIDEQRALRDAHVIVSLWASMKEVLDQHLIVVRAKTGTQRVPTLESSNR